MRRVLVVSLTKFFGGGESFISSHLQNIDGLDFYYLIASEQLCKMLPASQTVLIRQTGLVMVAKEIRKIVAEKEIDVVILNGGRSLFLAPLLHGHSACAGIRHTLNASVNASALYRGIYIGALNMSYCFMKAVVHVSQKSKSEQFLARQRAVVVYNGVSEKNALHKKKSSEKNFLFVGRMTAEKGVDMLINAFNEICQADDSVHLYLVGQGDIDESYPHCANIHFEGFSINLESYYLLADWYISLTSRENCSISVLDALSYGVPVITTDVGGNPELVQNAVNGFIIERSKDAVTELFNSALKNMTFEQYCAFSNSALQVQKEKFSLDKQKLAYKALLESL